MHMRASELRTYARELPKLEAQQALLTLDITSYPHWGGPKKSDQRKANRARTEFKQRLATQAYGAEAGKRRVVKKIVTESVDELRTALRTLGLAS